jgi:hypothetical protein
MDNDKQEPVIHRLRMIGRCANGSERDGGRLVHAVEHSSWSALCGAAPGRSSAGWSSIEYKEAVTCLRCRVKLAEMFPSRFVDRGAENGQR